MRRATPPVRQGPGLAEARAGVRIVVPAPAVVEPRPVVLVPATAVPLDDPGLPASLRALAALAAGRGWRTVATYSRAAVPPALYAAASKDGTKAAGAIKKPACIVAVTALYVERRRDAGAARGYGAWHAGRWESGSGFDPAPHRFRTQAQFREWIERNGS